MRFVLPMLLVASTAGAQEFQGARLISTAGTARATANLNDAIFVNPAGIALGKVYSIEANAQDDLDGGRRSFNGSILDSQAGPISAGLAYTYTDLRLDATPDNERDAKSHRADVAIATRLTEHSAIGITARYVSSGEKVEGEDVDGGGFKLFTIDAGFQYRGPSGFSLGLTAYNLTNSDRSEYPIAWGAGLAYGIDAFMAEADIRYNAKIGKARYSGALTYVLAGSFPIRAGASYDLATQSVLVAGGIGYQQGTFAADLGYRHRVRNGSLPADAPEEKMLALALRAIVF